MARPKLNPDTVEKICPVCNKQFIISFYLRKKRTYCSKSCANHDPKIIAKMVASQTETFGKNYGMHPMKTEQTKDNLRSAVKEKYGVDWISKSNGWYEKVKQNNLQKYGIEHYNNPDQIKKTCMEKYGVDNPTKYPDIREKMNGNRLTVHYNYLKEYCSQNNINILFDREHYYGYGFDNTLVSLMTFRRTSRFDKNVEWELSRFCNIKNTIIIGGASKLFSHFLKTYTPKSIVSYNDRRYFSGDLYHLLGFLFVGNTAPSYHYITPDYKSTMNRMNFQKHLLATKLKTFNATVTEWENMKNNGYDRIWDCGNGKWVWTID